MRCLIMIPFLILVNLSCESVSNDSHADHKTSSSSTENETETTSQKSFGELVDLNNSSTTDETSQPRPTPFDPPLTGSQINDLLQQCLQHLLTDADFKRERDFYGTPGSTEVVLLSNSQTEWPSDFQPQVKGFTLSFDQPKSVEYDGNRILGIRLEKLDVTAPASGLIDSIFESKITLVLSNVGGTKNGAVVGGCITKFTVTREGDSYHAKPTLSFDP